MCAAGKIIGNRKAAKERKPEFLNDHLGHS
jgi:hypothetical protein